MAQCKPQSRPRRSDARLCWRGGGSISRWVLSAEEAVSVVHGEVVRGGNIIKRSRHVPPQRRFDDLSTYAAQGPHPPGQLAL